MLEAPGLVEVDRDLETDQLGELREEDREEAARRAAADDRDAIPVLERERVSPRGDPA